VVKAFSGPYFHPSFCLKWDIDIPLRHGRITGHQMGYNSRYLDVHKIWPTRQEGPDLAVCQEGPVQATRQEGRGHAGRRRGRSRPRHLGGVHAMVSSPTVWQPRTKTPWRRLCGARRRRTSTLHVRLKVLSLFLAFPTPLIADNLNNMGLSLGNSVSTISVSASAPVSFSRI
jgi:hypothetical protein